MIHTIEQTISAGGQWDGTAPGGDYDDSAAGVRAYEAGATGGRFILPAQRGDRLTRVERITAAFGDAATWSVSVALADGTLKRTLASGTLGGNTVISDVVLLADEAIVIDSATSTTAMVARVTAHPNPIGSGA